MRKVIDVMIGGSLRTTPDQTVANVASLMQDQDAGSVAVEENGRLVGLLTLRDIAIQAFLISADTRIRDVMDDEVRCCHDDEDVETVARHMADSGIGRLPVVDRKNHLLGFVTLGRALAGSGALSAAH